MLDYNVSIFGLNLVLNLNDYQISLKLISNCYWIDSISHRYLIDTKVWVVIVIYLKSMIASALFNYLHVCCYLFLFSPLNRCARCISFGIIVTRFACIAHKLVSSKSPVRYDSEASWSASIALDWNIGFPLSPFSLHIFSADSLTSLWNGFFY